MVVRAYKPQNGKVIETSTIRKNFQSIKLNIGNYINIKYCRFRIISLIKSLFLRWYKVKWIKD